MRDEQERFWRAGYEDEVEVIKRRKANGYTVRIRRDADGVVREYRVEELNWEDHSEYLWTEGSFGCDCNLELFFERAAGNKIEDEVLRCGNHRFTAISVLLPNGITIMLERSS